MSHNTELAARLAALGDDTLIDVNGVAALLCITPGSARQAVYRTADFPPRFPTPTRLVRWRLGDVRAWIRVRAQQKAPSPVTKSRKAEQVRLQRLGDAIRRGEQ